MVNILIVDDHAIVRDGIRMLLAQESNFNIVAEARDVKEALEFISNCPDLDLVLTDLNMPGLSGINLIKETKNKYPYIKIVILSMYDNDKFVDDAFAEGADGYLLKTSSSGELVDALMLINRGCKYLCAELSMKFVDDRRSRKIATEDNEELLAELSKREIEVLHLIAEGYTSVEISDKLFLSKRTVEGHRQNLVMKTGSKNTAALMRYAIKNGIVN